MTNVDFLSNYQTDADPEWGNAEIPKPFADRHPVMQWYHQHCTFQAKQQRLPNSLVMIPPHAPIRAYFSLAYDLFVLNRYCGSQTKLIERIKNAKEFQGAQHELFAIATCLRAGFDIAFEDNGDVATKHAEFVGTHRATGQRITVEAKSKHRPGVLGFPGDRVPDYELDLRINRLLNTAFEKPREHPFVVFFDLNLPQLKYDPLSMAWFDMIAGSLVRNRDRSNGSDPWNLLLLSNCRTTTPTTRHRFQRDTLTVSWARTL